MDNKIYKKLVDPPKPTDLLNYSVDQLNFALKTPTIKGPVSTSQDSSFIACMIDTDRISQVKEAYFKVRLLHARAHHIVCAYNLPCDESENHLFKDSCDDGESGAGSHLLKIMKINRITHRAVFVARYCGTQKLGDERLTSYVKALENLMKSRPMNAITRKPQAIEEVNIHQKKPAGKKKYGSQAGAKADGGRGRGGRTGGAPLTVKTYAQAASP